MMICIEYFARLAFATYYEFDLDEFHEYLAADQIPLDRESLADAIRDDLRDLLHNANESDLFPILDQLSESTRDLIIDQILDYDNCDKLTQQIADLMLEFPIDS